MDMKTEAQLRQELYEVWALRNKELAAFNELREQMSMMAQYGKPPAQEPQRLSDDDIEGICCDIRLANQPIQEYDRQVARAIEAAIVPPGYVVLEAESVREIITDIEQHIGQGKESEKKEAAERPGYGTGTYTHLWRKMQKLRGMIAAAPKVSIGSEPS